LVKATPFKKGGPIFSGQTFETPKKKVKFAPYPGGQNGELKALWELEGIQTFPKFPKFGNQPQFRKVNQWKGPNFSGKGPLAFLEIGKFSKRSLIKAPKILGKCGNPQQLRHKKETEELASEGLKLSKDLFP